MSFLIRVGVGSFKIESAYSMEYLKTLPKRELIDIITPIDKAVEHLNKIEVPGEMYKKIVNGVQIRINQKQVISLDKRYRIYCLNQFIGIGTIIEKGNNLYLKMSKVFI